MFQEVCLPYICYTFKHTVDPILQWNTLCTFIYNYAKSVIGEMQNHQDYKCFVLSWRKQSETLGYNDWLFKHNYCLVVPVALHVMVITISRRPHLNNWKSSLVKCPHFLRANSKFSNQHFKTTAVCF